MSVYKKYYEGQEAKLRRRFEEPKVMRRWCLIAGTWIELVDGVCQKEECSHRFTMGCVQVRKDEAVVEG